MAKIVALRPSCVIVTWNTEVVPGGVIRLSFVVSLTFSPVLIFFESMSSVANSMASCMVFWLVATHCQDRVRQATEIFLHFVLFLPKTFDRTLVPVLGNVGYRLPHRYPSPSNSTFQTPAS
ncbi:hypothetical protein Tco_1136235 [Tanacetum coccineum]